MVRARSLSRVATRLAHWIPFSAMFAASCGTSGTLTGDAGMGDSALVDASLADDTSADGNGDAAFASDAGGVADAPDAQVADAPDAQVADAPDAQVADAPFMTTVLGSADKLAVFSGATVENAAGTVTTITGDLGTYPGVAAVGLTPPVVVGTMHLGDGVAQTAATDIQIAYDKLSAGHLPCDTDLTGKDLGGKTLVPGVYCFSSTAGLTGTLTLDALHEPDAVWVFQVGSALTTAVGSRVIVINGTSAQVCNAFWQITSAATLGTSSVFGGNILSYAAITVAAGTSIVGRALCLTAKVSTDTSTISIATCPGSAQML